MRCGWLSGLWLSSGYRGSRSVACPAGVPAEQSTVGGAAGCVVTSQAIHLAPDETVVVSLWLLCVCSQQSEEQRTQRT